jgi:hypothetical protein
LSTPALGRAEAVVDASGVAPRIEAKLPLGVRPRQLSVRTLLVGLLLALCDGRPAHLRRVHGALAGLTERDQGRLGVSVEWRSGPHGLTYRQVERTFSLVVGVLAKGNPDGAPSETLQEVLDALIEASVPESAKNASASLALDWTDVESFSTRRTKPMGTTRTARRPGGIERAAGRASATSCSSATTSLSPPWSATRRAEDERRARSGLPRRTRRRRRTVLGDLAGAPASAPP